MKTKKIIAFALIMSFVISAGDISFVDTYTEGTKVVKAAENSEEGKDGEQTFWNEDGDEAGTTPDTAYQIGTAAQLRHLYGVLSRKDKNKKGKPYSECYYQMVGDITLIDAQVVRNSDGSAGFLGADGAYMSEDKLAAQMWTPIQGFNGHFDGKGHFISGLYMTGDGAGLFANVGEKADIHNLTIKNSIINSTASDADFFTGKPVPDVLVNCVTDKESCHIGIMAVGIPQESSTAEPTVEPTKEPEPTITPTKEPEPTVTPTKEPEPTVTPTKEPEPTVTPTKEPESTVTPTKKPEPTVAPTKKPEPTVVPTSKPDGDKKPAGDTAVISAGQEINIGGASYQGTGQKNEVIFSGTDSVRKGAVSVPDTVTVNGVTCKVTTIGEGAFAGNKKIKKVTLGKNVKTIGKGAFKNCTSLKSVKFPAGIKTLSAQAFYNCRKIKQIKLPTSVRTIGKGTFKNCVSMKKFSLGKKTAAGKLYAAPAKVGKISIGASAMANCIKLRQIVINAQVRRIGNAAFSRCKNLADILVYSLKLQYVGKRALKGVSNCKISVPKKKVRPYTRLFRNKGQGKKVVVAKLV